MKVVIYSDKQKEKIIDFIQRIWQELGKTWEPGTWDKDLFDIPTIYQKSGGNFWLILDAENHILGTVALRPFNKTEVELKRFYLDPNCRGQGIGSKLLERAIAFAQRQNFKNIKLDTSRKSVRALHVFNKFGFREIHPYLKNVPSDMFMQLDLIKR
jgi:GNAT superfamily N-acetyltransferase